MKAPSYCIPFLWRLHTEGGLEVWTVQAAKSHVCCLSRPEGATGDGLSSDEASFNLLSDINTSKSPTRVRMSSFVRRIVITMDRQRPTDEQNELRQTEFPRQHSSPCVATIIQVEISKRGNV